MALEPVTGALGLADTLAKIALEVLDKDAWELVEEQRKQCEKDIETFWKALDSGDSDTYRNMAELVRTIRIRLPFDTARKLGDTKIENYSLLHLLSAYAGAREREFYKRALEIALLKHG